MMNLILTQCFPPAVGGIETLMGGLAQTLSAKEETMVFADGAASSDDSAAPYSIMRFDGIKFLRRRRKALAANKLLQSGKVRRVFCDSWKSLELINADAKQHANVTVFAHGSEYPLQPSGAKHRTIQQTLAKASRVHAVSNATRERMRKCGVNIQHTTIWHPPLTPPDEPNAGREQAYSLWHSASPRLLTLSRLAKRKGIDTALLAVAELIKQYPDLRYIIAGDGEQQGALQELTAQLGLQQHVCFAGRVSASLKSALYESADVFVLPSHASGDDMEGFGLVFLEAAYFNVPSVAGNAGGAAEAVEDGVTGVLCRGDNHDSVRDALQTLLADEKLRRQLGENAGNKARRNLWLARADELVKETHAA